jgi:hypothetical protein
MVAGNPCNAEDPHTHFAAPYCTPTAAISPDGPSDRKRSAFHARVLEASRCHEKKHSLDLNNVSKVPEVHHFCFRYLHVLSYPIVDGAGLVYVAKAAAHIGIWLPLPISANLWPRRVSDHQTPTRSTLPVMLSFPRICLY